MPIRSPQTLTIEAMLKEGQNISAIARQVGVSRQRIQRINRRSQQTLTIEAMVKEGKTNISEIARQMGVSRARVQQIKRRLLGDYESVIEPVNEGSEHNWQMKSITINLTPAVHDALVEACGVANRRCPEEPINIQEYVEDCVINRVVELGLLRRKKRK